MNQAVIIMEHEQEIGAARLQVSATGALELQELAGPSPTLHRRGENKSKDWRPHWADSTSVIACYSCDTSFSLQTRKVEPTSSLPPPFIDR